MILSLNNREKDYLKENLDSVINLFCESHEELKEYCRTLDEEMLSKYFEYSYERMVFFSQEGASDTYHNYYCFVFALIMKEIFPEFAFYARVDEEHVALGCPDYIFDICGIYHSVNGELRDINDDEYFDASDDEDFLFDLTHYFSRLNIDLESRLREIFYSKVRQFLERTINKSQNSNLSLTKSYKEPYTSTN